MQMRAGGAAGAAHIADDFTGAHFAAGRRKSAHVGIEGFHAVAVLQHHGVAVAAFPAFKHDFAIGRRFNRRAGGCGIVDAGVHFHSAQHGVEAHAVR